MRTLLEVLTDYASETRVGQSLQTQEYRRTARSFDQHWEDFCTALTDDQRKIWETLQSEETDLRRLENIAFLRAGVSIGMELSRF